MRKKLQDSNNDIKAKDKMIANLKKTISHQEALSKRKEGIMKQDKQQLSKVVRKKDDEMKQLTSKTKETGDQLADDVSFKRTIEKSASKTNSSNGKKETSSKLDKSQNLCSSSDSSLRQDGGVLQLHQTIEEL